MSVIIDFIAMHGHGWYVWSAYGSVFISLAYLWQAAWRRAKSH